MSKTVQVEAAAQTELVGADMDSGGGAPDEARARPEAPKPTWLHGQLPGTVVYVRPTENIGKNGKKMVKMHWKMDKIQEADK